MGLMGRWVVRVVRVVRERERVGGGQLSLTCWALSELGHGPVGSQGRRWHCTAAYLSRTFEKVAAFDGAVALDVVDW